MCVVGLCVTGCNLTYHASRWALRFVLTLQRSSPPDFGIAGPLDLNNEKLMTQVPHAPV